MKHHACIFALCALVFAAPPAFAQHAGHGSHTAPASRPALSPAAKAFDDINSKMHKAMAVPLSGNADVDFVRGMIPHHQGAVEMAEVILKFGKDHAIHGLASGIIKAQKSEIDFMTGWLARNTNVAPQPEAIQIKAEFEAANADMHKNMMIKSSNDADKDFLLGMIPHHEGAIAMAKVLQKYGKDAELQKLASEIIASQAKEIADMRGWLSKK